MNLIIYFVAFLEGFTTLSVEIVALRRFTPIIGSNSISTSIILGVILLALSYGYFIGGKISAKNKNLKNRLVKNLLFASMYYFFISFTIINILLTIVLEWTGSYFFAILISSVILFFIPVFLASQTIPILAELMKGEHSGEKMGKLLFYSTIGSFIGAVGTSSFFFPLIGVFKTGVLSSIILSFSALLLSIFILNDNKFKIFSGVMVFFYIFFAFGYEYSQYNYIYKHANSYHDISIFKNVENDKKVFSLNGGYSSGIYTETGKSFFGYVIEVEKKVKELKPKNILVIGAAGFTFPNDISEYDFIENIDVIDVDPSLKDISETYFLEKKLSSKIHFFDQPSRYFINQMNQKKYDFILVDAYSGQSLPPQVLTVDFYNKLNEIGENIYFNIILDFDLKSEFSHKTFATLNHAFGNTYYKDVGTKPGELTNIIITNHYDKDYILNTVEDSYIYTDDKNSIELDLFKMK